MEVIKIKELEYTIIGSGSSGNCVVIENIMVDCGLPYKKIADYLYDIDYLLLTHIHSDHINSKTFNRIREEFPNITVIGNYEVAYLYDIDIICNANVPVEIDLYKFIPFEGEHNVLVYGYTWQRKGFEIIYATDMNNFENAPDQKYDYLFLESNHDEKKLNAVAGKTRQYGYDVFRAGKRHCSTQKCLGYYYAHRRNKNSQLIELHKSKRFY